MSATLKDKLTTVLQNAGKHNSGSVTPTTILWPDKERQWASILPQLRSAFPQLLTLGDYDITQLCGPAIWIKCVVAGTVTPEGFSNKNTPIIYLPGISKDDLKNPETAGKLLQPLIPYAFTGTVTAQYNGREWTVQSLMENKGDGLGLSISATRATKEAMLKALPTIFDERIEWPTYPLDAGYMHTLLFPNAVPALLQWLCKGDTYLESLSREKAESFIALCETRFSFTPDSKNINLTIAKLGSQQGVWKEVWQHYAAAPKRYEELAKLLRAAKPDDLGTGLYTLPEESWPQVAESGEETLRADLDRMSHLDAAELLAELKQSAALYQSRAHWVWQELDYMPLAKALPHLVQMCQSCAESIKGGSLETIRHYYLEHGVAADRAMRSGFACVRKDADTAVITKIITAVYKPWLERLALKFQELVAGSTLPLQQIPILNGSEETILFVDAFRYEIAMEFTEMLQKSDYSFSLEPAWSALPSLTATAKVAVSPVASEIDLSSVPKEFLPQLKSGKSLSTVAFREALQTKGYTYCSAAANAVAGEKCWLEIGDIDTKGHAEGAALVRRIPELFQQIEQTLEVLFSKGIEQVKIITDHGWLLLPDNFPKTYISKDLIETRCGRCAFIKEGVATELLSLPWHWNREVYIAYAPGISFFKAGEAYAHGGVSLQECLVPVLAIKKSASAQSARIMGEPQWMRMSCTVETQDALDGYLLDIRTKIDEPKSTLLLNGVKAIKDNKAILIVDSDYELAAAIVVLMDASGKVLHYKHTITGA